MNKKTAEYFLKTASVIFSLLIITFIFSQSLLPAGESQAESGRILSLFNGLLTDAGIGPVLSSFFVRKFAHFTEFAVLGTSFFMLFLSFGVKPYYFSLFAFLSTSMVAVCDECLQLISDGRACQISDMLLDSFGGFVAITVLSLIYCIFIRIKRRKSPKYE
ncbi:MAG: VanZ family protein [Eubacteriales bacterium]|nr:VanZ family protein [Eubacteriales bacterium]